MQQLASQELLYSMARAIVNFMLNLWDILEGRLLVQRLSTILTYYI
jgi:hypothetical protein